MKRRIITSCLTAILLIIGMMPAGVFADSGESGPAAGAAIYVDAAKGDDADDGASEAAAVKTLAAAFDKAETGATVELLSDCDLNASIAVAKDITLDLNSHKITVEIKGGESTQSAFAVAAGNSFTVKDGKIFGKTAPNVTGNGVISNKDSIADNRAIEAAAGSTVTVEKVTISDFAAKTGNGGAVMITGGTLNINDSSLGFYDSETKTRGGNFASNGGAVYAKESSTTINNTKLFYNTARDDSGEAGQYWFGGGALFADHGTVTLSGNYFFYNRTWDYGGNIHLDAVENATLTSNRINNGMAYNHRIGDRISRGADGGGIYSRISKTVTLTNNTINKGFATSNGAGLCIIGNASANVSLSRNTITGNDAGKRGGGIYFSLDKNATLNLTSGTISDNTAAWGAGINYTGHDMPVLKLQNVLITENTAARGAGIWACPTSETVASSTLGGAIYGNTASGEVSTGAIGTKLGASGDEIRYEGKDYEDSIIVKTSDTTTMTVMKRALGGGLMQWYKDNTDARYKDGDAEADPKLYTNTDKSFGLHGILSEEYQNLAKDEAQLIIKGNAATGRGGGIATNSPVEIGLKDADVTVKVTKTWNVTDKSIDAPAKILVDLYRVSADGTETKLDHDVELNAENNWTATFSDLPSQDSKGDITYVVKEQKIKGWSCTTDSTFDKETKTYNISLTNQSVGRLKVTKEVTNGGSTTQDFTFKVTLSNTEINGQYGDLEFKDGVATFTLKHGESITTKLPAGVDYTVEETEHAGYNVKMTGEKGTIRLGETSEAVFTNEKIAEPVTPGDKPTDGADTGDTFPIWMLAGTALLALAVAGALVVSRRRVRH